MEIYTSKDSVHEGPQWWAEVVENEKTIYATTWYEHEVEALNDVENWLARIAF